MAEIYANSLEELSVELQEKLLDYISYNLTPTTGFNYRITAGVLKQPFTRQNPSAIYHITNKCFMDAMIKSGYRAKIFKENAPESEQDWYFNTKLLRVHPI